MNVLIVEDEGHTAALLREMIEQDADFVVTETLETVVETVEYLSRHQQHLDLLFFDIQLADGHSFEVFRHVDVTVPIVFCTAFDEYTLQAIQNNGIDYVLKPFQEAEIHRALGKYKQLIANVKTKHLPLIQLQTEPAPRYQQIFLTQYREKTLVVRVQEVALFYVAHDTVHLYTFEGAQHPLFKKMEYIEQVCDPAQFYRINRQMLVNRAAIVSFEPTANRKVVLQLTVPLAYEAIVSRLKVTAFKDWLER